MKRIFISLFLLAFSFLLLFFAFYLPDLSREKALYNALPFFAPLSAFVLGLVLAFKDSSSRQSPAFIFIFLYFAAIIGGEFALREVLPLLLFPPQPPPNIEAQEFLRNGNPQSKRGIIASSAQGVYIFGELLKTPSAYIGRNFARIEENSRIEADYITAEENQIMALNLRTIRAGRTNAQAGITALPLPFSLDPLYAFWGEKNPQRIALLKVIGRFEIFQNPFLEPYKKTLFLAFARYGGTLILLIIAAALGLGALNSLDFSRFHFLGALSVLGFGFPAICMIHFYIIEMINAAINGLL